MASTINYVGHGLVAGDTFRLVNVDPPDCGINEEHIYYVLASGLTADSFQFSETDGGAAFVLTYAITSADLITADTYAVVSDGVMDAPTTPTTPDAPSVASVETSGLVKLKIVLAAYTDGASRIRNHEVQVTHKYDGANPDWTYPQVFTLPWGSNDLSIHAAPSTAYAVRVRVQDVYGNYSAYNTYPVELTTAAGNDALYAGLASIANDVPDGTITETKIADDSISTPKLKAGAITADLLAATLVLSSLIKTAASGTRVEISSDGIQLYDSGENLLVNIPTNGDPVYVKGRITAADTFTSEVGATLYGVNTLPGSSVTTLANGISAPTSTPGLTASVDYLPITTPTGSIAAAAGIAYDGGNYWVACDPTVSPYYVAQKFNGTTGALMQTISATGSVTTYTTTLGSTSHVSDTWTATSYAADSQIATPLTLPTGRDNIQITKVAGYLAGYLGGVSVKMGLWSSSGVLRRHSAAFTAAEKTFSSGNDTLYNKSLSSPYSVAAGTTVWAGWCRTTTGQSHWWTIDNGTGKTTKHGANYDDGDFTSITTDSSAKPNVYITYTYDVDSRLETAANVGIASDGTYVYTLDKNGKVWKYLISDGSYVTSADLSAYVTGTKANAGLFFYNNGTPLLVITTTTGTGAGVYPKFIQVTPSTLAVHSTYPVATGPTFSGTTDTFRGGAYLADPLNSNAFTFWIATTSAVYAYAYTAAPTDAFSNTANRNFGTAASVGQGITHDGTQFRGWATATPTKVWKFTNWDWTTASAVYWVGYAWYDSAGTTHETVLGPRTNITMRRRERLYVTNAAIPTGGADDPNNVRIYMKPNATEPAAGSYWLQATGTGTGRYLTTYTGSGTADFVSDGGGRLSFPAGTPAEIKSSASGWSLKGDGTSQFLGPTLIAQDATHEGGEITFMGAGAYNAHTLDVYDDRIRIHSNGNENLSVVSGTGKLTARGPIHTDAHAAVSVVGTTAVATTVTTATTWYAVSGIEVAFTPAFIGQKWLIVGYFNGYHGNSSNTIAEWNLRVVLGSDNTTILDRALYYYYETPTANQYNGSGGANVWVADRTSQCKLKLYVSSSANSTSVSTSYYSFKAIPIP